jgi:hypothetical protein
MRIVSGIVLSAIVTAVFSRLHSPNLSIVSASIAAAGALVLMLLAITHRRKMLGDYEHELNPRRTEFKETLERQFGKAIDSFCAEMAKRFQNLKDVCQRERERYGPRVQRTDEIQTTFASLKSRLG